MFVKAWITSAALTLILLLLTVVAKSQQGVCYDGDPLQHCPNAHGLAEWGFLLGALFAPCSLAFASFTLVALVSWLALPTNDGASTTNYTTVVQFVVFTAPRR